MLENKRVIITGAGGTLGKATASAAAGYGADVVGLDIVPEHSSQDISEYHCVDLTDREATTDCIAALGHIDGLVNIAGGFAMGEAASEPDDTHWEWMFRINVDTMRNATMAAVPVLKARKHATIVNIGALGALNGQAAMSAYCCAKSSVMKLTESLSEELKRDGVNVNAVLPSIIDTPPNREAMPDADFDQWVKPAQLAEVICFLSSQRASALHGVLLPVKALV